MSLEDLDESQIKAKLNNLLYYLETELNFASKAETSNFTEKDQATVDKIFEISPANSKKKLNQTFCMFEKTLKLEEKKEIYNLAKNKNTNFNNSNTHNYNPNNDNSMQIENPNFFFTSASPKKKEPKNIQLRKQENVNTFTKSNSLSTNNSLKSSKKLNQKLLNMELRLKAYLKESHQFFKTKSIDKFLENSESLKEQNQKVQFISVPDFDEFANQNATCSNKSSIAEVSLEARGLNESNVASLSNSKAFYNLAGYNTHNFNNKLKENSNFNLDNSDLNLISGNNDDIFNNNSILSNKNISKLAANNNANNASGLFKRQQSSNVSSINYSTNHHKAHNTTTPFSKSNGTIPSIFKNFFEEKEVKELNKKRHSMAVGDLLHKNTLKNSNFSVCEIKQKYQSNYTANNSNNFAKLNLFLGENQTGSGSSSNNKESRISDFSLDINLNNNMNNSDSNEDSILNGLQEGERDVNVRTNSFNLMRRNSILREQRRVSCRTNGYMNSFDVVVEEEKNVFGTNTSEDNSDEECERKCVA